MFSKWKSEMNRKASLIEITSVDQMYCFDKKFVSDVSSRSLSNTCAYPIWINEARRNHMHTCRHLNFSFVLILALHLLLIRFLLVELLSSNTLSAVHGNNNQQQLQITNKLVNQLSTFSSIERRFVDPNERGREKRKRQIRMIWWYELINIKNFSLACSIPQGWNGSKRWKTSPNIEVDHWS